MSSSDHFVQFYEADSFLTNSVAEWLADGLRAGETCIVVATPAHASEIERVASNFGADIGTAWKKGQYVLQDAEAMLATFMAGDAPDEKRFDDVIGALVRNAVQNGPLRAFGEMVAVLTDRGNRKAAIALEELWNKLGEQCDFSLFCAYPMRHFASADGGNFMSGVCGLHSRVIPCEI